MNEKFLKPYNSAETEDSISKKWEESGYFNPDNLPERHKESFSIVLPPPNVTGVLHMGSALMLAIEDIMVRHNRMKGKKTLWIPGTDHAAIATQAKVEKEIQKKEGKSRHDLGREELIRRVDAFAKESRDTIVSQIKKMGASVDWSREAFTLDEKRNLAVRTAFKRMYDDGLIYRGYRVVNWDPKGQTTISDDEIVYEPRRSKLYTFKYSKDIPITISTTRPETKLGDTAIAVHPDDPRYQEYIGKEYDAVFAGEPIHLKVIADQVVEKEFGTGALGVTPVHSAVDWEIAQRHGLPLKQVIDEYAKVMTGMETVKGKKTAEARDAVVAWLKEEGLLEKEEEIDQNVATAERTGGIIEPLPKLQWFIGVNKEFEKDGKSATLKGLMKKAVESKSISILPDRFEKIYFNWIGNLLDWCISRQIWYGHRVPVWYRNEEIHCGVEAPSGEGWIQDEDTLDTWFSSGLWTFSTLGWPEQTEDLKNYHPTSVLETGTDILFFWVARMILMSSYLLGEVPFRTVYLHGLVRDSQGKKISKSLGNNIDPLDLIAKYGADAVRMSLIVGVGPGSDSKVGEDKVKAYKNFANKLWNITRFILTSTENSSYDPSFAEWSEADAEIMKSRDLLISEITKEMDEYKFYLVAEKIYHYSWHEFADKIIEESKAVLSGTDVKVRESRVQVLLHTHRLILKVLHPFMPFVTEEIWGEMDSGNLLLVESWPQI
ncbi:MAG: valine--tRNA ligase [bacterium]|nr:valine--tRNA ligase [bacterium]